MLRGLVWEWVMARHRYEEEHLMTPEELTQIRRELALAIEQQRINQQISEGRISLAPLLAAYLELQCLILVL